MVEAMKEILAERQNGTVEKSTSHIIDEISKRYAV